MAFEDKKYPYIPFSTHSWRLSHHTGAVNDVLLYQLLLAASLHLSSRDAPQDITTYLVANGLLPANIRTDSGQADIWRDYQQVLSEAGLMFSTRSDKAIRFTATGLAYLDRTSSKKDILTIQAFRWQYPNGHNTQKSSGDSSPLNFTDQQIEAGILLRPAVMVWQVLNALQSNGQGTRLTASEIEHFLFPARTHKDTSTVVQALIRHRSKPQVLTKNKARRRNALDWIIRLARTHPFRANPDRSLTLSEYSLNNRAALADIMDKLVLNEQWWMKPSSGSVAESWYQWYGTQNSALYPVPLSTSDPADEGEAESGLEEQALLKPIALREYAHHIDYAGVAANTVTSTYSAELSESAHRLHDTMVRLIAERCLKNGGKVFYDPKSVDLLVQIEELELLLEVKSTTAANFAQKLRGALGQVLQYDFLRSKQSNTPRRLALAVTVDVPENHWSKEFVSDYLNIDLVALRSGALHVYSLNPIVQTLLSAH